MSSTESSGFGRTRLMAPSAPLGSAFGGAVLPRNFSTKIVNFLFSHEFGPKMAKKISKKKNPGKISKIFFSIFPNFFSIDIILRECRLRTYHDPRSNRFGDIACDTHPDRQTDRQTQSGIYYIGRFWFSICWFLDKRRIFAPVRAWQQKSSITLLTYVIFFNLVVISLSNPPPRSNPTN